MEQNTEAVPYAVTLDDAVQKALGLMELRRKSLTFLLEESSKLGVNIDRGYRAGLISIANGNNLYTNIPVYFVEREFAKLTEENTSRQQSPEKNAVYVFDRKEPPKADTRLDIYR